MCGIVGYIKLSQKQGYDSGLIHQMNHAVKHRGPDDGDVFEIKSDHYSGALGHRRLAIIDLSPLSRQPMHFMGLHLTFNGEIYNFKEIRQELISKGYSFESQGDSEVLLKGWHCWGSIVLKKLNGMFAFSIWNSQKHTLTLARDRTGIKPLFYLHDDKQIVFGSELRPFQVYDPSLLKVSMNSVQYFLRHGYMPTNCGFLEPIRKLEPGKFIEFDLQTNSSVENKYWSVFDSYSKEKITISDHEATERLEDLLVSAIDYRLIADVPVGLFLSGGYDSSALLALISKRLHRSIKSYTIGFEDGDFDESPYAKAVAKHLGGAHETLICGENEAQKIIMELPDIYDEPFGDQSAIPTTLLSRWTSASCKVALSADGADELLGGYSKYISVFEYQKGLAKVPSFLQSSMSTIMNQVEPDWLFNRAGKPAWNRFFDAARHLYKNKNEAAWYLKWFERRISDPHLKSLLGERVNLNGSSNFDLLHELSGSKNDLDQLLAMDFTTYLRDDILTKVDRASMSTGLEAREPFLDHRVVDFAASLSPDQKIKVGNKKHLLKQIVHKYLPKKLMDRPKQGFAVPVNRWMRKELKELFEDHLSTSALLNNGFANGEVVEQKMKLFRQGLDDDFPFLWHLFVLQIFLNKWQLKL